MWSGTDRGRAPSDYRRRPRLAGNSRRDRRSSREAENRPLSSSLRRPRLRPNRGCTRHRPWNGGGNPQHSPHEAPGRPWRGDEMSDFVNSVLDELVPTFSEEAGDWERVVADAGAETPATSAQPWLLDMAAASAAPRRRHGTLPALCLT